MITRMPSLPTFLSQGVEHKMISCSCCPEPTVSTHPPLSRISDVCIFLDSRIVEEGRHISLYLLRKLFSPQAVILCFSRAAPCAKKKMFLTYPEMSMPPPTPSLSKSHHLVQIFMKAQIHTTDCTYCLIWL